MTFDTRPSGAADPAPPALRAAIGERLLIAGVDCITTSPFGANRGNLGEYGIADRIGEFQLAPEQSTDALIRHDPQASCFSSR